MTNPMLRVSMLIVVVLVVAGCSSKAEREARALKRGGEYFAAENWDKARVEYRNALQLVPNDGEARYRNMETYSTGMLQRVKLAQALVHDPKLLFLDEPTNGLDPDGRIEMLELVREVASRRGVTVILSSHLLPDVQHVCERVVMINRGRVIRDGLLSDLMAPQDRRFELRLRDCEPEFLAGVSARGVTWVKIQPSGNLLVTLPDGMGTGDLFEAARSAGTQVRHFRPARQSLEEAFIEAIAEG